MKPINKALIYIENHLDEAITIERLSKESFISPFHFARVFKGLTGYSVMQYVRFRRMTEAAKLLATNESSVLEIAFQVGYTSHAAFTKAFVKRFQCTPSESKKYFEQLIHQFIEPIFISNDMSIKINPPREEEALNVTIAGMQTRFAEGEHAETFYNKIVQDISNIQNVSGKFCNVIWDRTKEEDNNFHYRLFAGLPVSKAENLPKNWMTKEISEGKCLVFEHEGNTEDFTKWVYAVFGEWFPRSNYTPVSSLHIQFVTVINEAKTAFHREMWVPVKG